MFLAWGYPVGRPGENKNTEHALQLGTIERVALIGSHE
jgi:hypothetical protein